MEEKQSKTPEGEIVLRDLGLILNEFRRLGLDADAIRASFDPTDGELFRRLMQVADAVDTKKMNSTMLVWRCLLLTVSGNPNKGDRRFRYEALVAAVQHRASEPDELTMANELLLKVNALLIGTGLPFVYVTAPPL